MIRALGAACLCGLLSARLYAAAGKSGGDFLNIVQSPRAVGMGEAGTGIYGDLLGAMALNPAALARTGYREAAFTYNSWLEGVSLQQAAYAHPLGGNKGVLAGSFSMLNMAAIEGYNNSGDAAGKVTAGDMAVSANYAVRLAGPWQARRLGLFAGAGVKYAREKLDTVSAGTQLFDAGLLWISDVKYGTLGLFRANQIPEITPIIVEKAGLNVACGAIGIGEITSIPTAPAIADAYYRYDGKFRTSLPLEGTPYSRK